MHGDDPLPNIYSPIDQHADHYHFDTGTGWTHSRADLSGGRPAASSDLLGGGHAHSGLLIYQGGNWPAAYEGALLTLNFHGRRINRERLERQGSGYTGRHAPDFGQSSDPGSAVSTSFKALMDRFTSPTGRIRGNVTNTMASIVTQEESYA